METRVCFKCHIEKPITEYYPNNNRGERITTCKECQKIYNKKFRESHLEQCREWDRERHYRDREKRLEQLRENYAKNKEVRKKQVKEYYSLNKDKIIEKDKIWRKKNPEKVLSYYNNRDAKRRVAKQNGDKITGQDIVNLFDVQQGHCFYCNIFMAEYHIDHIIPLSKGGEHKLYNLVLACPKCNMTKNSQDPEKFINKIIEAI